MSDGIATRADGFTFPFNVNPTPFFRHVLRLEVFGSAARADFDPESSDLDFLVEFEPMAPVAYAQAYFSLKEALEALFKRPVDLITPAALNNPYFRASLAASSERVYAA